MEQQERQTMTDRLREFFASNPDEELTIAQCMVKFDITRSQFDTIAQVLKAEGLIESVHVVRNKRKGVMA